MRVLVLGHSKPYAEYARDKGIVLFNVLDSHGIRLPNLNLQNAPLVVADRTSVGEILSALYRRGIHQDIDAVFTNSEAAMITAAAIAKALNAVGLPVPVAIAVKDKAFQKDLIRRNGINVARSALLSPGASALDVVPDQVGFPAVLKPLAAAGSVAVTRVRDAGHLAQVLAAYADLHRSLGETWLAESFVDGTELHMDGLVINGQIEFLSVGRYLDPLLELRNGKLPGSVILDPVVHELDFAEYRKFGEQCLAALGLATSVFHLEFFEAASGLVFSECAARCGGQFIVPAIEAQYGIDLELAAFQVAIAGEFTPPTSPVPRICAGWTQLPVPQGRITRLPSPAQLAAIEGVLDISMDVVLGDDMPDSRADLGHRAGIALIAADSEDEAQARITALTGLFAAESESLPLVRQSA
jgi:biotin carboxylase